VPITKNGIQIKSLLEWKALAPPKSAKQWVDGRSAKESARAWLEGNGINLPFEVHAALSRHVEFGGVGEWDAEPEARLPFDKFTGEPRNSDLAVLARDSEGQRSNSNPAVRATAMRQSTRSMGNLHAGRKCDSR
jgi:hypothetical protein